AKARVGRVCVGTAWLRTAAGWVPEQAPASGVTARGSEAWAAAWGRARATAQQCRARTERSVGVGRPCGPGREAQREAGPPARTRAGGVELTPMCPGQGAGDGQADAGPSAEDPRAVTALVAGPRGSLTAAVEPLEDGCLLS